MNVDCRWISQNLESFFCDQLTAEEDRLARTHIDGCAKCGEEIRGFTAIDPLIRKYFQHQLAVARAPKRRSLAMIYGATAASAIAAVVLLTVVLRVPEIPSPAVTALPPAQIADAQGPATAPVVPKNDDLTGPERAKPRPATAAGEPSVADAQGAVIGPNAPDFLVIDPAGYSRTLQDYRGYTLVLGIWSSDQPEATTNFERLYRNLSPNTKLRFLGVSGKRSPKPANTTFPVAYNQGSRLLNAKPGDFALVDAAGSVRLRGSLIHDFDSLSASLRNQ